MTKARTMINNRTTLIFLTCAGLLLLLSWTQVFDRLTLEYLDDALRNSGMIYATARSINGLVSVLQGTEVSAVFVTFTPGEILDPINDLIERFSGLMLLALGSLALKTLLVSVASHGYINALITGLVLVGGGIWFTGIMNARRILFHLLLCIVVVRLVLPLMVLSTQAIDRLFLAQSESEAYEGLIKFQKDLAEVNKNTGATADSDVELAELRAQIETTAAQRNGVGATAASLDFDIARIREQAESLPRPSFWKPWEEKSEDLQDLLGQIATLEQQLKASEKEASALDDEIEALKEQARCVELRSDGKSCSLLESATAMVSRADPRPQLVA